MKREDLEKLLERQIHPEKPTVIHLPSIGEDIHVRPLSPGDKVLAGASAHHKDEGERQAQSIASALRYAAVDEKGDYLFKERSEAMRFLAVLDQADFEALGEMMSAIFKADDGAEVVDLESAKNS